MADAFDRSLPHMNIGSLGHVDHGKTTLLKAIIRSHAKDAADAEKEMSKLDKSPESKARGVTIAVAHVEVSTPNRHYAIVDCPGHKDYIKNMITGAAQMDGGILVVSSTDGAMPQTKEHLLLAKQVGVSRLVVCINKFGEPEEEILELIKMDIQGLLEKYGYSADTPIVLVNALGASKGEEAAMEECRKLMATVDEYITEPERATDQPFLMPIEDVFSIEGRGTVVTGRIERGTIKMSADIEVMGLGRETQKTAITGIEMFNKSMTEGQAGDNAGLLLRGLKREDVERGQVLVAPGSVQTHTEFKAEVYILGKDEGGRHTPFVSGYKPQFYIRTADVTGEVVLNDGVEMVMPGDNVELTVKLINPCVIEKGMRFAVREGGQTVGNGVVTDIIK